MQLPILFMIVSCSLFAIAGFVIAVVALTCKSQMPSVVGKTNNMSVVGTNTYFTGNVIIPEAFESWNSGSVPTWTTTGTYVNVLPTTGTMSPGSSMFTFANGILTYTGTKQRYGSIEYMVTYSLAAAGSIEFANSINGGTAVNPLTQGVYSGSANANTATLISTGTFVDKISLNPGDTVFLVANQSVASNTTITTITCRITMYLN